MAGHHENGHTKGSSLRFGQQIEQKINEINAVKQRLNKFRKEGESDADVIQRIHDMAEKIRQQKGEK